MKYLFCIGAQKAGSTYLYNLLKQHSDICFTKNKEIYFFSHNSEYRKGIDNYIMEFSPEDNTEYCADFTPEYTVSPRAIERIAEHFSEDAKIIILLRDPIDRAFSQYRMKVYSGKERRSFKQCINSELKRKKKMRNFVGRGRYVEQLDLVYKYFNKNQVLTIGFKDLTSDTVNVLDKIYSFLDIKKMDAKTDVYRNKARRSSPKGITWLFYQIPYTIRRKLPQKSKLIKKALSSPKWHEARDMTLDDETRYKLSQYYKAYNQELTNKYGIVTRFWQ